MALEKWCRPSDDAFLPTLFGSNYFLHSPQILEHAEPLLWFLPRAVEFNPAQVLPGLTAVHGAAITICPAIILVWTALGLFTGVFLEGFFKGERLSGARDE